MADKPQFIPVTPAGRYVQQSPLVQLKNLTGSDDLMPLHRIDRETRISLLRSDGVRTLYQLEPVSGKRHQLRVHMPAQPVPSNGSSV